MVRLWKQYDYITVREDSAEKLLRSCGIEAHTVLDPTLMLTKSEWEQIASGRIIKERYILVYQLHKEHQNVRFEEYVAELKKKAGLRTVKICFSKEGKGRADIDMVLPKVTDYLSLILYADFVISDSFHATSFSINLHTNFEVILPVSFSTRIENILEVTDLKQRIVRSLEQASDNKEINFDLVEGHMNDERMRSLCEIEKALSCAGVRGIDV